MELVPEEKTGEPDTVCGEWSRALEISHNNYDDRSRLGGVMVSQWVKMVKIRQKQWFLRAVNIRSTPSLGGEAKPESTRFYGM
jgi:hypothetical protein